MLALTSESSAVERPRDIAISSTPGAAVTISAAAEEATSKLKSALADERLPKAIHDYKAATHVLERQGVALRGVQHDPMLYSYLLDPTYSSHGLADVALRRFSLKLSGTLPEAADIAGRLATALRREVEEAGLLKLYEEIDLPLVPALARMEHAGSRSTGQHWQRCRRGWSARSTPRQRKFISARHASSTSVRQSNWATFYSTS